METAEATTNLVLIGDGYVGKTCVLQALKKINYQEQMPNLYGEFQFEKEIKGKLLHLNVVDTAGQEEYDHLRKNAYIKANIFILCFCVADKTSYENILTKWIPDIQPYRSTPIILVGTKSDLRTDGPSCISKERGIRLQKKIGAAYYVECSAKMEIGINDIVDCAVNVLMSQNSKKSCVIQ